MSCDDWEPDTEPGNRRVEPFDWVILLGMLVAIAAVWAIW